MNGSDLGKGIAAMIAFYIAIAFAVGAALTALIIFGVPWLWGILKPYLHIWTAP